ncbi:MAG: response regulator [Cyclobacteriaceae bacterium]
MNRSAPLIFICLLIGSSITAQTAEIDGLKELSAQSDLSDSLRHIVYEELAWTTRHELADQSVLWADTAVEIARNLKTSQLSRALITRGKLKGLHGIPDYGYDDLFEALDLVKELQDSALQAETLFEIAYYFDGRDDYLEAIEYALKSLAIKEQLNIDPNEIADSYKQIGLIYQSQNNWTKGMEYFQRAMEVATSTRFKAGLSNNLALIHMGEHRYDTARYWLNRFLERFPPGSNAKAYSIGYGNLAICYWRTEVFDSAIFYADSAIYLKNQIGDFANLAYPALTMTKVLMDQKNYRKALKYVNIAEASADSASAKRNQHEAASLKAEILSELEQYKEATYYFDKAYNLLYQITDENDRSNLAEMEARYQTGKKEAENEALKREAILQQEIIDKQKQLLIGVIILVLLLFGLMLFVYRSSVLRKRLLTEIQKQKEQIEYQSNKLKQLDNAKSRFFANISHDLRSPLTLILGSLDQVLEDPKSKLDEDTKDQLKIGYKNGKRLLFMADEIRDLTRLEEGKLKLKKQHVRIESYLKMLVKMFSSAASQKEIALSFSSLVSDELTVEIDPHQFEKVIYNLLSNAVKHTQSGGEIKLEIDKGSANFMKIMVQDNGAGIPSIHLPYVFDRFYIADDQDYKPEESMGVGLALTKEIVELHQGQISVTSELNNGTTFSVLLPSSGKKWVSEEVIQEIHEPLYRSEILIDEESSNTVTSNDNSKTILIVEDHREIRNYLKRMLEEDYNIITSNNGQDAMVILDLEQVDLVITDLMMPYMDGFELIEKLKSNPKHQNTHLFVVSARTNPEDKHKLLEKGADAIFAKPFDPKELKLRITNQFKRDAGKELIDLFTPGTSNDNFDAEILARLKSVITSRIDDNNLSVMDLAEELAASERKVYRLVKKVTSMTPHELIKETRWQYIKVLLDENKVTSASEAGRAIGMNNVTHFKSQFESRFGKSIEQYLK